MPISARAGIFPQIASQCVGSAEWAWINPGAEWTPGTDFVEVDGMPAVHFSGLTSNCEPGLR